MDGLAAFGYQDLQRPKSKKNFDFTQLDVKAIRILNRISGFVKSVDEANEEDL